MRITTDLWFATYLLLNKVELADYVHKGHRKLEFSFDMSIEDWKQHKMDYMRSPYATFEMEMGKLKELLYGN